MFIGFANMPFGLYQPPKDKIVLTPRAEVAQLVEQWTENPCVGGSSPPLGTIFGASPTSTVTFHKFDACDRNSRRFSVVRAMVPKVGVEPTRAKAQRFLRPSRLPFRHFGTELP